MKPKKVIILSIKPKYAKMIYEGTKAWEFRKKAPPVGVPMLIYESAPVSKVTGPSRSRWRYGRSRSCCGCRSRGTGNPRPAPGFRWRSWMRMPEGSR